MVEMALTAFFLLDWVPRPRGWEHVLAHNFVVIGVVLLLNIVATTIARLPPLHGLPGIGIAAGILAIGTDAYFVVTIWALAAEGN
jgi:hypothetical protein